MSIIPNFFNRRGNRINNSNDNTSLFDPFSLSEWDPLESLSFPFSSPQFPLFETAPFAPSSARVDWRETASAHVFAAEVPGRRKEDGRVEVEDGRALQISVERRRENEEKGDTWHRVERSSGRFVRRFPLPENAVAEGVKAAMEDGVLTVTVPKAKEETKKNVKAIEISG